MHPVTSRRRGRMGCILPKPRPDRGDTLVEVLVTIVIMSIAMVALLTSLLTSTGSSTTHRGIANIDGILSSFAESSRYQIQTQPEDGNTGPLFRPCATSYALVSDPYPSSAPAGSTIALFVTGFAASHSLTLTVGTSTVTPISGGTTNTSGNSTILFAAPSTGGAVSVSDAVNKGTARTPFAVGTAPAGITASTFQNYVVSSSVQAFPPGTSPCSAVTQQQVTLSLKNPDPKSLASDNLSFVVGNFAPTPVVVSVSSDSSTVPATVTYVANVTDITGTTLNTGTVTWTFPAGTPGSPTCANSNLARGQATCVIHPTYGQQGTFVVTGAYTNTAGSYPSGISGQSAYTLTAAVPTINVSWNTDSTGAVTFNAQVIGGGTASPGASSPVMTWQIVATPPSGPTTTPSCSNATSGQPDSTTNTTVNYSCLIGAPTPLNTYTVSANYAGNTNYANAVGQNAWIAPQVTVAATSKTTSVNVSFSVAGLTGGATPSGTYSCSVSGGLVPVVCLPGTLDNKGSGKFSFVGVTGTTYTVNVTYFPDSSSSTTYIPSSGSTTVTQ